MVTHAGEPRGPLRGFSPTPHMWWDRGESLKRPVRPAGRGRADGGGPSMAGEDHDLIDRIAQMLRDAGVECEILNLVPTDEAVLRRDRVVIVLALTLLAALAWSYLLWLSVGMDMGGMDMTGLRTIPSGMGLMVPAHMPWREMEFASVFAMWTVMMVGMMTPSAAPMFLIYAGMGRQSDAQGAALSATVWSLLAMWTRLHDVCLSQCQMPFVFLMRHGGFHRDAPGCVMLGLRHGAYCVGCCWTLMALLLVGGVMNVVWIALLALLVFLERVSKGNLISKFAGIVLIAAGAGLVSIAM